MLNCNLTIDIPQTLGLNQIPEIIKKWPRDQEVTLKLAPHQWVDPVGLVSLACLIDHARKEFKQTPQVNFSECSNVSYWERMDFFECLKISGPNQSGNRHEADGRFSEMRMIKDDNDTDSISKSLVETLNLEKYSAAWRAVNHIITEAINNVCHHSESFGYAHAQYTPKNDHVNICIADTGIGLKQSLSRIYQLKTDAQAIEKALEPCVTSNPPQNRQTERRNRGVGLTTIQRLVDASCGVLHIWSGDTLWRNGVASHGHGVWQGTLVAISIKRDKITPQFSQMMKQLSEELAVLEKAR
ncbi:ATP-binding protein [Acetobacter fabarum]|uniref:ATP-binding protein n=1 Tax=Acetobacter fabarum TaxID=483199 RepID=UPI00339F7A98